MSPVRSTSLSSQEKLNRSMMEEALRRGLVIPDLVQAPSWELPLWTPQPKQRLFLDSNAGETLMGGAAGGGKSAVIIQYTIERRYKHPGSIGGLFRLKHTDLFGPKGLFDEMSDRIGNRAVWNLRLGRWTFPDGGIIHLGFMPKTWQDFTDKYQGTQFDDIAIDESTQWPVRALRYLTSRVRSTVPNCPPQRRYTANPGGTSHAYFKSNFVDPALRTHGINNVFNPEPSRIEPKPPTRCFIPSLVTDNVALMDRDPDYKLRLENLSEIDREMLLHGNWDVFTGQFFSEWDESVHIWPKVVEIPADWNRVAGLDWGINHPTVVYWGAVDPGYGEIDPDAAAGTVWLYREMWVRGKQVSDKDGLCERIKEHKDTPPVIASGDDIFTRQKTTLGGPTIASEFAENGVILSNPCAGKRRRHRWQQMRAYLQWRDDDMKPIPGRPRLRILAGTCPKLCEQMAVMTFSETDPEDMKKVNIDNETGEGGDDCVDALSVLLMSQPWASLRDEPGINPATISDKLTAHQILELKRQKARRRNKRTGGRPTRV